MVFPCCFVLVGKYDGILSLFFIFFINISWYMSYSKYSGSQGPLLRVQHYYMKRELGKFMHAALMVFSGIPPGFCYTILSFLYCFCFVCILILFYLNNNYSPPAIERLSSGLFQEVIITNTIPVAEQNYFPQLTILTVANLLGETIWRIHDDSSVSSIFQ